MVTLWLHYGDIVETLWRHYGDIVEILRRQCGICGYIIKNKNHYGEIMETLLSLHSATFGLCSGE